MEGHYNLESVQQVFSMYDFLVRSGFGGIKHFISGEENAKGPIANLSHIDRALRMYYALVVSEKMLAMVNNNLNAIFSYREDILNKIFHNITSAGCRLRAKKTELRSACHFLMGYELPNEVFETLQTMVTIKPSLEDHFRSKNEEIVSLFKCCYKYDDYKESVARIAKLHKDSSEIIGPEFVLKDLVDKIAEACPTMADLPPAMIVAATGIVPAFYIPPGPSLSLCNDD